MKVVGEFQNLILPTEANDSPFKLRRDRSCKFDGQSGIFDWVRVNA